MTRPEGTQYNPALIKAYDKCFEHSLYGPAVKKSLSYAVGAYFRYGPLSSITIKNELELWKDLRRHPGLTDYERTILYTWLRQEPKRIEEAKNGSSTN